MRLPGRLQLRSGISVMNSSGMCCTRKKRKKGILDWRIMQTLLLLPVRIHAKTQRSAEAQRMAEVKSDWGRFYEGERDSENGDGYLFFDSQEIWTRAI